MTTIHNEARRGWAFLFGKQGRGPLAGAFLAAARAFYHLKEAISEKVEGRLYVWILKPL
jgi:hypothetical protein